MDRHQHSPDTEMSANSAWFDSGLPTDVPIVEPQEPSTLPQTQEEMDEVIFESLVSPYV
jgi:hypothetical protein